MAMHLSIGFGNIRGNKRSGSIFSNYLGYKDLCYILRRPEFEMCPALLSLLLSDRRRSEVIECCSKELSTIGKPTARFSDRAIFEDSSKSVEGDMLISDEGIRSKVAS
jgi:hypothetical protein